MSGHPGGSTPPDGDPGPSRDRRDRPPRQRSSDSRAFGPVPVDDIDGIVWFDL